MPSVTYTAKRKLVNSLNDEVTLDFDAVEVNPRDEKTEFKEHSYGGAEETTLIRIEEFYQVKTLPTESYDEFQEFLFSVAGGEVFEFDPDFKSTDVGYSPIQVTLDTRSPPSRLRNKPTFWEFNFTVRLVDVIT